jgi:RNA polymerase sigma factor (sigma-70 family)
VQHSDSSTTVDDFERRFIRKMVSRLIGKAGFRRQDREDLEQDFLVDLLRRLESFNPKRSPRRHFVMLVVKHYASSLLRKRHARKRDYRKVISLHTPVNSGDGTVNELAQTISQEEYDQKHGRAESDREEMVELATDVRDRLNTLSAEDQSLAGLLTMHSVSEVAEILRLHRSTVSYRVRRLRPRFRGIQMENSSSECSSSCPRAG